MQRTVYDFDVISGPSIPAPATPQEPARPAAEAPPRGEDPQRAAAGGSRDHG